MNTICLRCIHLQCVMVSAPMDSTQQIVDLYTPSIAYVEGGTMRKTNIFLMMAITLALFASVAFGQITDAAAQKEGPVGIVVAYIPGQSITIMDQNGDQSEFALDPSLKILPPGKANSIAVGSFVTVIAPASLDKGKQIAVGIVVHPKVPDGWKGKVLAPSDAPLTKETSTATPTGTLMTETGTPAGVETATATAEVTRTATPTPPAKVPGGETTLTTNAFIEWLRSLFQQVIREE
jgi:hypothetical protein